MSNNAVQGRMVQIKPEELRTPFDGVDYPFLEDENGAFWGYGHIDKAEFTASVNRFLGQMLGPYWLAVDEVFEGSVEHIYCVAVVARGSDEWTLHHASREFDHAFPVTRILT